MRDLLFAVINLTNCILFLNNIINFNNFSCISCTIFVWQNYFITKNNQWGYYDGWGKLWLNVVMIKKIRTKRRIVQNVLRRTKGDVNNGCKWIN